MVVDEQITSQTHTREYTPRRRFLRSGNNSTAPLLTSPIITQSITNNRDNNQTLHHQSPTTDTVPPIKPFTLGDSKLNMSSLSTAVRQTQSVQQTTEVLNTNVTDEFEQNSASSMDTSDVSTILKPKSIFNPYSKTHKNHPPDSRMIHNQQAQNSAADRPTFSANQNSLSTYTSTNISINDGAPLVPLPLNDSTNQTTVQGYESDNNIAIPTGCWLSDL
jgi:hypothetical protein